MQKSFYITSPFDKKVSEVLVNKSKYSNDRTCLELIDVEDGIPYAVASVNLPNVLLEENEILIKDYSKNQGVLDFLVKNNIVKRTEKSVESGSVWIPVCILNDESEWGNKEINVEAVKNKYEIDGYQIWATSYEEALKILPLIQSV